MLSLAIKVIRPWKRAMLIVQRRRVINNAWQFIRIAQVFLLRAITWGMPTGWLRYRQLSASYDVYPIHDPPRRVGRRLSCTSTYLASVRRLASSISLPTPRPHTLALHSHIQSRRRYSSNAARWFPSSSDPPPVIRRLYQILDYGNDFPRKTAKVSFRGDSLMMCSRFSDGRCVFSEYFVNGKAPVCGEGRRSRGARGAGPNAAAPPPVALTTPRETLFVNLVVSTALNRSHARLPFEPAGSQIMQCLTNSIGGLGRSTVFNLHCISNRIFSVSVTQCVRKKLCRRFWRILCKTV